MALSLACFVTAASSCRQSAKANTDYIEQVAPSDSAIQKHGHSNLTVAYVISINKASKAVDNGPEIQRLCDDFYEVLIKEEDAAANVFLSFNYYDICMFRNHPTKEDNREGLRNIFVRNYIDRKAFGVDAVNFKDKVWATNMERCAELLVNAYRIDSVRTLEDLETADADNKLGYKALAETVIRMNFKTD